MWERVLKVNFQFQNKGVVLGVYKPADKDGDFIMTKTTQMFDQKTSGQISNILKGM